MEIATTDGDCVFTPAGLTTKTTTFTASGNITAGATVFIPDGEVTTTIDNNLPNIANPATYTHFDQSLRFVRDSGAYREYDIGILGDNTSDGNILAFGVHGGGAPDPNIMMGVTSGGNLEIAGDLYAVNVRASGNVGINETNPTEKLEVGGNISLTGGLNIGGTQANGDAIKLTSQSPRIVNTNGFLTLQSEYNIEFETDQNGNNGGAEYKFSGRSSAGTPMSQRMNLHGGTGNLQIQGTLTQNHNFSDDRLKTDEAYLENATESIGKLSVQTYNKEKLLNFNLLERTGETVSEVGLIAQEVYYNAPEFRNLIETGYNKTYDASYTTYEDVSHTIWDGDVSNTTFEKVSTVVPKRLKTSTKIIPSEMDLIGVPIGEDPDYEAAGWSKEDPASVNYQGFIPYLIKSIQELTERLAALENK
jgi:hypothetical protein